MIGGNKGFEDDAFLLEGKEMEREFMGLKMGMSHGNGFDADEENVGRCSEAQQVEELERMMGRMLAVKGECMLYMLTGRES